MPIGEVGDKEYLYIGTFPKTKENGIGDWGYKKNGIGDVPKSPNPQSLFLQTQVKQK